MPTARRHWPPIPEVLWRTHSERTVSQLCSVTHPRRGIASNSPIIWLFGYLGFETKCFSHLSNNLYNFLINVEIKRNTKIPIRNKFILFFFKSIPKKKFLWSLKIIRYLSHKFKQKKKSEKVSKVFCYDFVWRKIFSILWFKLDFQTIVYFFKIFVSEVFIRSWISSTLSHPYNHFPYKCYIQINCIKQEKGAWQLFWVRILHKFLVSLVLGLWLEF